MPEGGLPSVFRERTQIPGEGRLRGPGDGGSSAPLDPVTGLLSARALSEVLSGAVVRSSAAGRRAALVSVLLLNLREISEVYGSTVGDQVLAAAATRLKSSVRGDVTLVRLAGAEIALVAGGLVGRDEAESLAFDALRVLQEPVEVGRWSLHLSACAAATLSSSAYGDHEEFAKAAARTVARARELGHGAVVVEDANRRPARERLVDETRLAKAVRAREFVVAFQPIVDPASGELRGAEALLRWTMDGEHEIPPSTFVPLLEKSGMILDVTSWELMEVARAAAELREGHPHVDPPFVFVNVGPQQLVRPQFADMIEAALTEHPSAQGLLCVELTERALRLHPTALWDGFRRIRDSGARLALDDFGVGTSSFEFLRRYEVDFVQISRYFAAGLGESGADDVIVTHLVAAAKELGLVPVVEGVEREGQVNKLVEISCPMAQGFYWGDALPLDEIHRWLEPSWSRPEDDED